MTEVSELIAQRDLLDKQIEEIKRNSRKDALLRIAQIMTDYDFSIEDITSAKSKAATVRPSSMRSKVAPKYFDDVSGNSWSGRGLKPKWMTAALSSGRTVEEFEIK